jgi:predicted anti-sigma-YlaC factor YlaD
MSETECRDAILSAMSEFDGEAPLLSSEQVNAHLAVCENCRQEIGKQQNVAGLLQMQARREQPADLWRLIEKRIESPQIGERQTSWKTFALLTTILVAYKLLEMLPAEEFGFLFKLVPLIFVFGLFGFLKENPFKINTRLTLER